MKCSYYLLPVLLMMASCRGASVCTGRLVEALPDSTWGCAEWISAADAPVLTEKVKDGARAADGASWFVSTVKNEKKVTAARWMTAGLGVYDLYLNGRMVGQEVLRPGFTDCAKTRRSFTYDLTDAFRKGAGAENVLAAQVTPGWWADKVVTPYGWNGMRGKKCAIRGVLELTYADGTKEYLGTDTTNWKAGIAGPVRHAAIFDGEVYDAREKQGYETADRLMVPEINDEYKGEIMPTNGAEVYQRTDLALNPVRAYIWKEVTGASAERYGKVVIDREYRPGETITLHEGENLVVDFGQNCAAVPRFDFKAAEGTRLTCLPSELLNDGNGAKSRGMDGPEGSIHRLNLRIPETGMRMDYTFGPSGQRTQYCPRFTYYGYRLVGVTATADVTIYGIQSIPVSSVSQAMETGRITTGDRRINRLISNTVWGQRSNYLSIPTDCPQRDERLGWTADTQVFAVTGAYFANTNSFFHKWLHDLRDTQTATGAFPGVAPRGQYGTEPTSMMRVGWADAGVIVPWAIWRHFGDRTILYESWDAMEKYMDHVDETRYDFGKVARECGNYQFADWLSFEDLETCSEQHRTKDGIKPEAMEYWSYLGASYWLMDAQMMMDMARDMGRDEQKYRDMTRKARAYIRERFLSDGATFRTEVLNTMQTPNLFLLRNNIVEGDDRMTVIRRLRDNLKGHGNCLQTGFLGTSIIMSTLTDNGMQDVAYDLLFQRKYPSWLYSVDNGATTIWERWNSYTVNDGMANKGMNSFNHYAYGVVCQWLWETAAGIAPDAQEPGFRHIIMRPVPDRRLGWVKAEYRSAAGMIKSHWRYKGDTWVWTFTIPKGTTASVTLPGETDAKVYHSGTYTIRR